MSDGWKVAKRSRRRRWVPPRLYVSLNRRGEIAMNERAFDAIRKPANVTLMYQPRSRTIGVKFPVAQDKHFFPARRYGRDGRMRVVRASKMLKQFGIKIRHTLVFPEVKVEYHEREPMLILSLKKAVAWPRNLTLISDKV